MANKLEVDIEKLAELMLRKGFSREKAELALGKSPSHFRLVFHEMSNLIVEDALAPKPNRPAFEQMIHRCYYWGAGARALMLNAQRDEAIRLAKNTLRVAERYDLTTALALARLLYTTYGSFKRLRPSELDKISKKVKFLQKELNLETNIEQIIINLNHCILKGKDHSELKEQLASFQAGVGWRYNYFYFLSRVKVCQIENDENGIIKTCREAIECFKQYSFPLPYHIKFSFLISPIPIHIKAMRSHEAEKALNELFDEISISTGVKKKEFNWQLGMYLKMVNCIYAGDLSKAKAAWELAIKNNKGVNFMVTERLKVVEAVLHIYNLLGCIEMATTFRVGTFFNSVPNGTSDKKGLNVSIRTVGLLYMFLCSKKYTSKRQQTIYGKRFLGEVEKLPGYINKHLKSRDSGILQLFIAVEKANHRKYLFEKYEKKIVRKKQGFDFYDSAILPYSIVKNLIESHLR